MKKPVVSAVLLLLALLSVQLSGCDSPFDSIRNTSLVSVRTGIQPAGGRALGKDAVRQFRLSVAAADMETIESTFSAETLQLRVPAGPGREFSLQALNADGVILYEGGTTADLQSGETISLSINMARKTFTVSFDTLGGSAVAALKVPSAETFVLPEAPSRESFVFGGWYKEQEATRAWDAGNDVVLADLTLYAKWKTAEETISLLAIPGISLPVRGASPVLAVGENEQYSGTVSWAPEVAADAKFAAATEYTATITLAAKAGYTLAGVAADSFTVAGAASVTHTAGSGVVTANFPATGLPDDIPVTLTGVTQVGGVSNTSTTTALTLSFDADPATLSLADITLTGATKGALSGTGLTRTLTISALTVANGSSITVTIASPSGYAIGGSPKTVVVYRAPQTVNFTGLSQVGGTANSATTTTLTLSFDADPATLSLADITLSGATKGSLSGTGLTRTLSISDLVVNDGQTVSVAIGNPVGYIISGSPRTATVHNADYISANIGVLKHVPAGSFQRDATSSNISVISQSYRLSQYEITRAQYQAIMGTDPSNTGYSSGLTDPVQQVNWYHAIAFCNKLSALEGLIPVYSVAGVSDWANLTYAGIPTIDNTAWDGATANWAANGYRLPTEMEWMWAAMGATSDRSNGYTGSGVNTTGYTKGYAGSSETGGAQANLEQYAWYSGNNENKTHPAGTKLPNELGLFDMGGNVQEWCWDWSEVYPPGLITDYKNDVLSMHRTSHGGSWNQSAADISPTSRSPYAPVAATINIGFRVALGPWPTYTVSYNANGASSGSVPASHTAIVSGDSITVAGNTGNLIGAAMQDGIRQRFLGWTTSSDGSGTLYVQGDTLAISSNLVLYAKYTTDAALVGKIGPAGGIIFYDAGSVQTEPVAGDWRYMELAPPATEAANIYWFSSAVFTSQGFDKYAVGEGKANSAAIAAYLIGLGESNRAAQVCEDLVSGGYNDWYLPTHDELKYVYLNVHALGLGGFSADPFDARYWSGSEYGSGAFYIDFAAAYADFAAFPNSSFSKPSNLRVRAVRRF